MIVGDIKSQIDSLWLRFHSGGVTDTKTVIEQITNLLFIKRLDDLHIVKEGKACQLGCAIENPIFDETEKQQNMRWSKFKNMESGEMFDLVSTDVFDFIKTLGREDTIFAKYMKNAYLVPNITPAVFKQVITMISAIPMDNKDTKGDIYEYMLSKLSTAGINGQFRTPVHITKMMVELMQPTEKDTICDPACGSAGFLISVCEYINEHYRDSFSDKDFREFYQNSMFNACENDAIMIRIAAMNLMMRGIENPNMYDASSLMDEYDVENNYSLVLANPPFKGSLDVSEIATSLSKVIKSKKTELLFIILMLRIMKIGGRCATIVPDGVLFGLDQATKTVRKTIVEGHKLNAIISMPSGVFRPYAAVSTAILIFTKTDNGGTDKVWFYDMQADGFSLNDKRTVVDANDIPDIISRFTNLKGEESRTRCDKCFLVPVDEIRANGYDLNINKYKKIVYERKEYDSPAVILGRLGDIDKEIATITGELKCMILD